MENSKSRILYAGNIDDRTGKGPFWKVIEDTEESRMKAIQEGCNAFSTTSFSYEPENEKAEPIRYGSLYLDFDCKSNQEESIVCARRFLMQMEQDFDVNLCSLKYWISGGKGCHIEIPAEIFGAENGHTHLPIIYKHMVRFVLKIHRHEDLVRILDLQMYCMGRGRLLRCENIQRKNGRYKVQISADEMMNMDINELILMSNQPRFNLPFVTEPPVLTAKMSNFFQSAIQVFNMGKFKNSKNLGLDSLLNCSFVEHCWTNRAELSEPKWWALVKILMSFGNEAKPIVHLFSQGYDGYTEQETDEKIRQCVERGGIHTCQYVKTLFDCGRNCDVGTPAKLWLKQIAIDTKIASSFTLKDDGVYYQPENGSEDSLMHLCSPIEILGKIRSKDSLQWARLVNIKAPDGTYSKFVIDMQSLVSREDSVMGQLADCGVELFSYGPKAKSLIIQYLLSSAPNDTFLLRVNKVGWIDERTYVFPDEVIGLDSLGSIHFENRVSNLHKINGTLDDWNDNIGKYCVNNSLLILLTCYALTGPWLRPCGVEGGGIHIYGSSSAGKSTAALVAGSVCGGGGSRGYLRQWNSTHNALEHTAIMHNDNLLVLDEIGQASSETIAQIPYMLANGQGKARMRADASARDVGTWRLNFLSNGEVTINDKIQETGKYVTHVGQEVRVIDLPIDAGIGQDLYQDKHGYEDSAHLSDMLARNSLSFYGTPLRHFIKRFIFDISMHPDMSSMFSRYIDDIQSFVQKNTPAGATGQVQRVCRKFGLIAIVGEYAIKRNILRFSRGDAYAAAEYWFKIWLEQRGCLGNREIDKVLKRVQNHFEVESESRYVPSENARNDARRDKAGYQWKDDVTGRQHFLMLAPVADALLKGCNRKAILAEMKARGWLECTKHGGIRETKSIGGQNVRGYIFKPHVWQGEPDPECTLRTLRAQSLQNETISESEIFSF